MPVQSPIKKQPNLNQDHGAREVTNTGAAPQIVNMSLHQRSGNDYGLEIDASNLVFSQSEFGGVHRDNFGHARLAVDGNPVDWLTGAVYELKNLEPGQRTIAVELVSNDHKQYTVAGQPIKAQVVLNVGVDHFVELVDDQTRQEREESTHVH